MNRESRRLFRLAATFRSPFALTFVAVTLIGAMTVAQMLVASHAISTVFPHARPDAVVSRLLVWLLVLIAVRSLLAAVVEWSSQILATRVKSSLRSRLVTHLVARGPRHLLPERTGELVTTMMEGVEKLDAYYRRFVPQVLATGIIPLIVLVAVASLDLASAAILALTGPLIPIFMWLLGVLAEQRTREQWVTLSRLGGRFLDVLQGLPTLTMFGRERDAATGLISASEEFRVRTMGVLRVAFLSGFVLELAASVSTALVAASVGVRLIEGWMTFDAGLAVLLLAPEFYLPFRQLGQRHHAGMEGVAAAERIFERLDAQPSDPPTQLLSDPGTQQPSCSNLGARGTGASLELDHVTFTYPETDRPALENINLELRPGTMTAIVGESGAGKSTLVALVLRLVEPTAGRLCANGQPIGDMNAADWRRMVALVPQRPRFFDGSVLENLRIGNPEASVEDAIAAARLAEAHAFITALPRGYDTPIGEAAARLSGGEQQRVAIARALLKGAPILVLDEPTSSLDSESEATIARMITRLSRELTVLVVAHRLDTIRRADRILVLEAGRIVEQGSHADLCRAAGVYARFAGVAEREVA